MEVTRVTWNLDQNRPIYTQIVERIQMDIVSGVYAPGSQLPSVRSLALDAGVNPNTIQRAMAELERSDLVQSQRTSGRFITEDTEMIQSLRKRMAKEEIEAFLQKMKDLGLSIEDVIAILEKEN